MMRVAHRGLAGLYPENTMIAFEKCLEYNPEAIEMDVQMTKDGELVVFHDEEVSRCTGAKGWVKESYDAALDCMGLHMLVTDNDRKSYLRNAYHSLNEGAPMLLLRESYRKEGVYSGIVNSIEEWVQITGEDYTTPQLRQVRNAKDGNNLEVFVPTLPVTIR